MNVLLKYFKQDKMLFYSVLSFVVIGLVFLFGGLNLIKITSAYDTFFNFYVNAVGRLSSFLITVFSESAVYLPDSWSISIKGGESINIYTNFALRYNIFLLAILILLPGKRIQSALYFIAAVLFIWLLMGIKCAIEVSYYKQTAALLGESFLVFRSLLIYLLFVFKIRNNPTFLSFYRQINERMKSRLNYSIFTFLLVLIVLLPVSRFFELIDLSWLTNTIIGISQAINSLMGYATQVYDRYIILGKNWVYLGDPCLGIGVLLIFSYLILSIKSRFINQVIYVFFGIIFMIIMNAVRVSYLLIHIYKTGYYDYETDPHALSNYFFYSIVFILFLIYIYWFQDIKFYKSRK
jgi:exosortase/archaeosortase family protein